MKILAYKSSCHDACVSYVEDGKLVFSIEAEKDSGARNGLFADGEIDRIVSKYNCQPDILCGDSEQFGDMCKFKYLGIDTTDITLTTATLNNQQYDYNCIPHEMAHIACSFALSSLPERTKFYALVWEGYIGSFYYVDENFAITKIGDENDLINYVGIRYSFPYSATGKSDIFGHSAAGKIMAIAGLYNNSMGKLSDNHQAVIDALLNTPMNIDLYNVVLHHDRNLIFSFFEQFRNVAVTDPLFVTVCKTLQDNIFDLYYKFALFNMQERLPLVISGGCGLNCNWNTSWQQSGLFESVFVPPVTNDSGIAIGAAAVVQHKYTGKIKLDWTVYSGEQFINESVNFSEAGFIEYDLDLQIVAELLYNNELVIAWVQDKYEIGPRALCNRSLLAAPFKSEMLDELNRIKKRELFRPVAPVCIESDVSRYFDWQQPSPYMLHFQNVKDSKLKAVTHMDGTARVQTINQQQNPTMFTLLDKFKQVSGYSVLCNTSLNFPGCGFINRTSDLLKYVVETNIPMFVINQKMYISTSVIRTH
jgi:predicted NodU family carbamoyl transferase